MKRLHLISNAHLDPVWQWQWNEGAAAAISTFRVAADFCEQFDGYVFNHNEALLYMWTKEYEPQLFQRIQKLVKEGRWHIMGGWFLQPDCNMPSGEDFVRQILAGRRFFQEHFGVCPTTAVNFDSFGHTKGLVQILQKSGYDSYLFMRPDPPAEELKDLTQLFCWEGFAGSKVHGMRLEAAYGTNFGKAAGIIDDYIQQHPEKEIALRCWGIGDHGGGPSKVDLVDIGNLMQKQEGKMEILHSTPEAYFAEAVPGQVGCTHSDSLITSMPGCYTTMSQVKRKHRDLENQLLTAEKMAAIASEQGLMEYPKAQLDEAVYDLVFNEFHDVLTGTMVKPSEDDTLRMLDHGLEICNRIQNKAFFALSAGQPKAKEGEIPILIFNPHPYPITDVFSCEFMLADQNWEEGFTSARVRQNGVHIPCQMEKEDSNIPLDWRKRITFYATLEPMSMNRFDCELIMLDKRPTFETLFEGEDVCFSNDRMSVRIGRNSGWIDSFIVDGKELVQPGAGQLRVFEDNEDPWSMFRFHIDQEIGAFTLMDEVRSARFASIKKERLSPLHVVENGDARLCVEAFFEYHESTARVLYKIPKQGAELEMDITVYWMEKEKMLKCAFPAGFGSSHYLGQTAFGVNQLAANGSEQVAHAWIAAVDQQQDKALAVINNGVYGSSMKDGVLYQNLLRSTAYTGHPLPGRVIMMTDRFAYHVDQGERRFQLWLTGGKAQNIQQLADQTAQKKNQSPWALSLFPYGGGQLPLIPFTITGARMDVYKKAEDGQGCILRLYNPSILPAVATIDSSLYHFKKEITLKGYEVCTLRIDQGSCCFNTLTEEKE